MPSDDIAISVRNLTKSYRLFGHPGDRIKQFLSLGLKQYHRQFTALQDVSFDIRKGETVGIIGRNGSGKSTLLQLICGILKPTEGTVKVNGRISALLELGAGFNPEFTGRENVYFQGALMGFSKKQMDERFDDISAFADIGEFVDQPVRTYSSGMFVRLAFAVAVHVDPEILVVDEALAVGDAAFQAKCLKRIDTVRKQNGTILMVTHAMEQVAHHCDRAILLDHGQVITYANTPAALQRYLGLIGCNFPQNRPEEKGALDHSSTADVFSKHPAYKPNEKRWGDGRATITDILIAQNGHRNPRTLIPAIETEIRLQVQYHSDIDHPIYGLSIKSLDGAILFSTNSRLLLGSSPPRKQKAGDITYPTFVLTPVLDNGDYLISVGIASDRDGEIVPHDRRYDSIALHVEALSSTRHSDMRPSFQLIDTA